MTQSLDPGRQQVLAYLKKESYESIDHLKALVQQDYERIGALIEGLSQAQVDFSPAPEEWSIAQVMRHLIFVNQRYGERITSLARGEVAEPPIWRGMMPPEEGQPFSDAAWQFQEVGRSVLESVAGRDPSAHLELTVAHPAWGPLNWKEWLVLMQVHSSDHAQQIQTIKATLDFPKA